MENELLRFAEFIDSEPSLAIASPRSKVKMYLQKIAADGDLADVVGRSEQLANSFNEGENAFIMERVPVSVVEVLQSSFYRVKKFTGETILVDNTDLIKRIS